MKKKNPKIFFRIKKSINNIKLSTCCFCGEPTDKKGLCEFCQNLIFIDEVTDDG